MFKMKHDPQSNVFLSLVSQPLPSALILACKGRGRGWLVRLNVPTERVRQSPVGVHVIVLNGQLSYRKAIFILKQSSKPT